jgi:hypothetical protein
LKGERRGTSETEGIAEKWTNGKAMSEVRFVILCGERERERENIICLQGSQASPSLPSGEGSVKLEALGWLETVA